MCRTIFTNINPLAPSCAEWHANFPQNVAEERAAAHRRAVSAPGHAQIHAPVSGPIIATNTEHYSSGVADPERHAYRESLGDPERHFHPDEVADLERLERHVQLDSLGEAANNVENDDADTKPDPNVHLYKPLHPMYVVDYFLPEDYHYMFPNTAQDMRDQMQLLINLIPKYEWRITELKQLQNSDCEYMVPCNLDTKLRKAISHLFGRNKLQTRSVPEVVWIYWCRKHYQRVKYRLGTRFAVKQMDLVKKTLWRIWLWSQLEQGGPDMVKNNPSPRVLSWKLITRKREKEKQNTNKRKADSMEEGAEDENPSREDDNANHDPTSAVTGWLLEKCDQTYSTVQMLEILRRVELELQDETRSKMPEIEILPNFPDGTGGRPVSKPKSQRRKSSAAQLSIAQLSAGQLNAGQLNAAQLNVAQPGTVQLNGGHQRAQSMGFPYATTARYAATNDQGGHVRRTSHPANSFVPSVSPPPAFAMPPPTPYNTPQLYQNGYAPTPTPSYLQAPARLDFSFASPAPQSAMAGPLTASFNMPPMQNHQRRASQPGGYSYGQSTSPELGSQHTDKRQCVEEGTSGIHGVTRRNEQRTVPVMQPGPSQYSYGYITQSQSFTNQPSYGQQPVSGYQQSYGQQPVGAQQQSYGRQSAGGLQQPYAQQPTGGQAAGMPRNYSYNYQRLPTPSLSRGNGGYGAAPAGGTKHMRHHSSHC
ncbi:hypothetical protein QBC47DRAFT_8516 [Echria macrotheca]|uniref:Uncharacterized protein n=1 Tax=Echria macrotheca TaxID=438768 RepID=A0AAJ0BLS3_9PEZI|nr:hypothetical protein QBC47DRAFT_8516 [Echria macrotheca]